MVVRVEDCWLSPAMQRQVEVVADALRGYCGHRSVWLDEAGMLWHAEPDEALEPRRYVGTFFRPDLDTLEDAVAEVLSGRFEAA